MADWLLCINGNEILLLQHILTEIKDRLSEPHTNDMTLLLPGSILRWPRQDDAFDLSTGAPLKFQITKWWRKPSLFVRQCSCTLSDWLKLLFTLAGCSSVHQDIPQVWFADKTSIHLRRTTCHEALNICLVSVKYELNSDNVWLSVITPKVAFVYLNRAVPLGMIITSRNCSPTWQHRDHHITIINIFLITRGSSPTCWERRRLPPSFDVCWGKNPFAD